MGSWRLKWFITNYYSANVYKFRSDIYFSDIFRPKRPIAHPIIHIYNKYTEMYLFGLGVYRYRATTSHTITNMMTKIMDNNIHWPRNCYVCIYLYVQVRCSPGTELAFGNIDSRSQRTAVVRNPYLSHCYIKWNRRIAILKLLKFKFPFLCC